MKKEIKKLRLHRETLVALGEDVEIRGGGSQDRACATYTEVIGPCVPTNRC